MNSALLALFLTRLFNLPCIFFVLPNVFPPAASSSIILRIGVPLLAVNLLRCSNSLSLSSCFTDVLMDSAAVFVGNVARFIHASFHLR